ncbi:two-component system histidine kinase PnpS [Bacillus sp. FJAT-45350]|uniref:two-component system histidine kinase PnpS n=1 Tax=Bacillus sp. FJAT-45350 TaxID=2011014 RepID=UPI000BB70FAB|nr:ATP-binding protein [Bacillus sp. FJAT-45350]
MSKYRFRLIASVLSITLLVLSGLGLIIGQLFKDFYFEQLTNRMDKEAKLAGYTVIDHLNDHLAIQEQTLVISEKLDARVTIILEDGTVIGESAKDPDLLDNHLDRPEIKAVLDGKKELSIRYSETVKAELLYIAVPLINSVGDLYGYLRLGIPIEELNHMSQKIWGLLIFSFTIAFGVIVLVTYRVANQMVRPIEEATKVANELAEGNFHARTIVGRKDEVGQLSRSINVLAKNLDQVTKRNQVQKERLETLIENMGSGLILISTRGEITLINRYCKEIFQENTDLWLNHIYHDVLQYKEVTKIVQDIFITEKGQRRQIKLPINIEIRYFDVHGAPIIRNEKLKGIALVFHDITELKKLEQVRKDFVANVSHELKTPVTSIKGFTETLLDGAKDSPDLSNKFLTIISKESERLESLISDLLELSRIEQQYFTLNWQPTNLAKIVEEAVQVLQHKSEEKEIALSYNSEGETIVDGDSVRIKQIAINLINNSIMYTPARGKVAVSVKESSNKVIVKVEDTGIGISETELPRIFERFYRVDRARSRNSGGTGLGLAIVKHLVEAHDGRILVTSTVGEGTTFTIIFNKKRV